MKSLSLAIVCLLMGAAAMALAQRDRLAPPKDVQSWEYRFLIPQETGPGEYRQVDMQLLGAMGDQGWELVNVTPWVLRNDLHQFKREGEAKMVTQNYLAYYFKRPRPLAH